MTREIIPNSSQFKAITTWSGVSANDNSYGRPISLDPISILYSLTVGWIVEISPVLTNLSDSFGHMRRLMQAVPTPCYKLNAR
jgi:hypothetical protein